MAGMLTGISGGILRDILCQQVPVVFLKELYASVSLAVCALFLLLQASGLSAEISSVLCFAGGLALRLLAIHYSWQLPTFSYHRRWD